MEVKKEQYKIIISGPVGAGKSTAIAALSDIEPVRTEASPSDEIKDLKESTTVAMDYGVIELNEEVKIHLYGTPGQERFKFMWDIMVEGSLGLILLMNNANPDPLKDLNNFLDVFKNYLESIPFCVGITHIDRQQLPTIQEYHDALAKRGYIVPVFSVDGRDKADVNLLLMAMLGMIDPEAVAQLALHLEARA